MLQLSKIAETQPHTAYAAFMHGLASKWIYFLRVSDWEALSLSEILKPLESAIQSQFIPAITPPGGLVREMLTLPVRHGGLGPMNPIASAKEERNSSQLTCSTHSSNSTPEPQSRSMSRGSTIKAQLRSSKRIRQNEEAKRVWDQLPIHLQRSLELSQEKGAST